LNAKAAVSAIRSISPDIPIIISATVADASGRLLSGQTIEAFVASVKHAGPLALGLNCGFGAEHILPYLRRLARVAKVPVSVHPNAGLPNIDGGYDETPEMFAAHIEEYLREGLVNIVGGCCGTTPEHIAAIAPLAEKYPPRQKPESDNICVVSGLEPLAFTSETNFVNIGERTNVAGSAKFARLIREGNFDEALAIAAAQVEAGAQVVDVCMDDAMIDGVGAMRHFLNLMASEPAVAKVPVMIDSSKWEIIEAGLQSTQGKSIVNSISLKEGEEIFLDRARKIMQYGAAAVVMLFDENGQADSYARKIEVSGRAYTLLTGIGFPPEDIIFDPNILAVATGMPEHDVYAKAFVDATAWIKRHLPYAKVSGGVSNLSFAFRGNNAVRKAMHAVFLYHAIKAGMDMAIVNPQMVQLYHEIDPELLALTEDLILYRREDAADRLIEYARTLTDTGVPTAAAAPLQWREAAVADRIEHALLAGDTSFIADDAVEAYNHTGDAVEVIGSMLMPAMEKVGKLFGEGKMFLPQVVKSARVMKQAVSALRPYMTADGNLSATSAAHKIILATVKGDVHDIGKNIVGIVEACDGYQVVDLGVMVPPETIVDEAVKHSASAICLSGLITPSLEEMIHVAEEVERRGLSIPI
ncbi:MAG: dihydropteroate synthase, partial [Muribaculaceae bacterium]|nr:dihydropteroate synthase [Muribaculaceae bacterium]